MKKPFVFISYSSKESDYANLVYSYLEGNGINCWIASRNIQGGESFAAQIVDAIQDCSVFVMIASEASNDSAHVSNELSLAFDKRKKIIPFRIQNFTLSNNNLYFLMQAQWIDAFDDVNSALKQLVEAVRTTLPINKNEQPIKKYITTKTDITKDETIPDFTRNEIVNIEPILTGIIDETVLCGFHSVGTNDGSFYATVAVSYGTLKKKDGFNILLDTVETIERNENSGWYELTSKGLDVSRVPETPYIISGDERYYVYHVLEDYLEVSSAEVLNEHIYDISSSSKVAVVTKNGAPSDIIVYKFN